MRLLGLDPGLRASGWGVIDVAGNHLRHVAHGAVRSDGDAALARRLVQLYEGLGAVIAEYRPEAAAIEETFANRNRVATLALGHARGAVLLAPACAGLAVHEYATKRIKKAVVGTGRAAKPQVAEMVRRLLPGCRVEDGDAADALAVAICHAHYAATRRHWLGAPTEAAS